MTGLARRIAEGIARAMVDANNQERNALDVMEEAIRQELPGRSVTVDREYTGGMRFHHGNGVLCMGTSRIAVADFDSQPIEAFRNGVFDEICATMNAQADCTGPSERLVRAAERVANEVAVNGASDQFSSDLKALAAFVLGVAPSAPLAAPGGMTAERVAYLMSGFKCEEKLLGPNEQAAIDYVLALKPPASAVPDGWRIEREGDWYRFSAADGTGINVRGPANADVLSDSATLLCRLADALLDSRVKAPSLVAAGESWRHVANEWADMATNGLQWVRNLKEGGGNVDEALASLERCLRHCEAVQAAAPSAVSASVVLLKCSEVGHAWEKRTLFGVERDVCCRCEVLRKPEASAGRSGGSGKCMFTGPDCSKNPDEWCGMCPNHPKRPPIASASTRNG